MSLQIDIRKLRLFNRMAKDGGDTVADHLSQMTGLETEMDVTKINFLAIPDIKAHVGDRKRIAISVELTEPPHGHILFLIDANSAKHLAERMVGGMGETGSNGGFSEMEKSAIQEVGNILTSAFIDGWADVLDTTIDISTPRFAFAPGDTVVSDLIGSPEYDMAILFDSQIRSTESNVGLTVYLFPDLEELVELMREIEV